MPKAVSSTAPPCFLLITYKCHKGLGTTQSSVWAQRCLALYVLIALPLQWIHAVHSPSGCLLGHILSKAERAADSKDQERCQGRCISDNSTQLKHPWFQPLALCNIRKVTKGQENVPKSCGSEEFRVSQMEEEFL